LNSLSERVLPELNDAFVETLNMGVKTVLELRMKIRGQMEEFQAAEAKQDIQAAVLDELLKTNEFAVPQTLIDDEIRSMLMRNGVLDPKQIDVSQLPMDSFREKLGDIALKRVRSAIIVDQIAKNDDLKASDQDIEKALEEIA